MSTSSHVSHVRLLVVILAFLGVASGCGPNPTQPSSLAGTWTGTVASNILGNVAMQLTLTQSGSSIAGTFAQSVPGAASSFGSTITGTVNGSAVTLVLAFSPCTRTWTGTWSGTTLSGTYVASGACTNMDSGTFTLTLY